MERSIKEEVKSIRFGAGDAIYGEGILTVTKALPISMVAGSRTYLRYFHDSFAARLAVP